MNGTENILEVYASGRRLHELLSLDDWSRVPVTYGGSPVTGEATAARIRYQHLKPTSDEHRRMVITNVLDTHVLQKARELGRVVVIAPAIVVETGEQGAGLDASRIASPRHVVSGCTRLGFERVPFSTVDTLGAGLETRADHALSRLAYQLACGGMDVAGLDDGAVSVLSTPKQVVATYAGSHQHFQVVLDDEGTVPMTLWMADGQVYHDPDFSECTVNYLVDCIRALSGLAPAWRCDELYVDTLLSLRRATAD